MSLSQTTWGALIFHGLSKKTSHFEKIGRSGLGFLHIELLVG